MFKVVLMPTNIYKLVPTWRKRRNCWTMKIRTTALLHCDATFKPTRREPAEKLPYNRVALEKHPMTTVKDPCDG